MNVDLWKLDFIHMIYIKERKKGKYTINKGECSMCYNFSPYVLFYSVTFKKNGKIHRDDDNSSVTIYFYNFDIKSRNFFIEGKPFRKNKALMINYNLKGQVINKIYINESKDKYYIHKKDKNKIIINDKK